MSRALSSFRSSNVAGRIDRFLGTRPNPNLTDTVSNTVDTPPPGPRPVDPDDVFELGEFGKEETQEAADMQADSQPAEAGAVPSELELLRAENAELRETLLKLEEVMNENAVTVQLWEDQLKEHEKMLAEKTEIIRELHEKNLELQTRPAPATPHEAELLAMSEELEAEKIQLKQDEESLMKQMRDMELQMSRERAELARQRNEMQRLNSDIRHELELAERDTALRDRLQPLQRRHQDMLTRRGGEPTGRETPVPRAVTPAASATPAVATEPVRNTSGLFKRLFG
jgi:hypothetical protein